MARAEDTRNRSFSVSVWALEDHPTGAVNHQKGVFMKEVRDDIKSLFERLLLGPLEEDEVLVSIPSALYLTGILWPRDAHYGVEEDDDALERPSEEAGDASTDRGAPVYHLFKPSSIGITCFVEGTTTPFSVVVSGARYRSKGDERSGKTKHVTWVREPVHYILEIPGDETRETWVTGRFMVPGGEETVDNGLAVHVKRRVAADGLSITVTLINTSEDDTRLRDESCIFQSSIAIKIDEKCGKAVSARTGTARQGDGDELINSLLYRDRKEYAVGHGVSALWDVDSDGNVRAVRTSWIPHHVSSSISPQGHPMLRSLTDEEPNPLGARFLARESEREEVVAFLHRFCGIYEMWISDVENRLADLPDSLRETAGQNCSKCREALARLRDGTEYLRGDDAAWKAFCLANEAMDNQSMGVQHGENAKLLVWRPFQLAFILMTVRSVVDPEDDYREYLDLLWFPTGGGKTEAYLFLIAFVVFYRRLTDEYSRRNANVDVLTRYTLRLLTIQQFQRASAMICACDQLRKRREEELGETPISIGLYVGQGSTPNRILDAGSEKDACTAIEEEKEGKNPACTPRQLLHCPLCGKKLGPDCYVIDRVSRTMTIVCANEGCESGNEPLPVHTVDEDIYCHLPSLVIATVDKFAQLPRNEKMGTLLGLPDGKPPALIIQDELHLISGPLGSMVGLYETALELLCMRGGTRPKIIGSTATIGRAATQVKALYNCSIFQFPPSGIDATDSFFSVEDPTKPDRLYMAMCSSGRSPKFMLQATIAALVQIAQCLLDRGTYAEGDIDPYWTCVAYFNSLRELGGAEVMIHDDVRRSSEVYSARLGCEFRSLENRELVELTSRVPSNRIPEYLETLKISLLSEIEEGVPVDVVLASNMISVGVDIPRLGLMVVNGQPKSTSEYIQATSRIGRGIPGLIITCLNASRPRDLSHFEHFKHYHQTVYSKVEATSVTPWSSRARDKALHAILMSAARHLIAGLSGDDGAGSFDPAHPMVQHISRHIAQRAVDSGIAVDAAQINSEISDIVSFWQTKVRNRGTRRLDYWARMNPFGKATNDFLMKNAEESHHVSAGKPTPNSLREVEPSAYFALWPVPNHAD